MVEYCGKVILYYMATIRSNPNNIDFFFQNPKSCLIEILDTDIANREKLVKNAIENQFNNKRKLPESEEIDNTNSERSTSCSDTEN